MAPLTDAEVVVQDAPETNSAFLVVVASCLHVPQAKQYPAMAVVATAHM